MNVLDDIYDILAQNSQWATQGVKDTITNMISHIDEDKKEIVFINPKNNKEFSIKLIED